MWTQSDLLLLDFQEHPAFPWAPEVPLGPLAHGTLYPRYPHHLQALGGSDLDPLLHQDTLKHQTKVRNLSV